MCGLPGHGPGDLIDLSFEGDTVSVIFDAGMSRPLRLTGEEALALVVALRTLAETPGTRPTATPSQRALAKVETAAGRSGRRRDRHGRTRRDCRGCCRCCSGRSTTGRALRLRYYTATRDETTERIVDPMRIFELDGRRYLEAWCRRAEGMRVFRVDRIEDVRMCSTSRPARQPRPSCATCRGRLPARAGAPARGAAVSDRPTAWVADYYPVEDDGLVDGERRISLRVADPAWVRALVLGSAGEVQVLSPEWLAESIRAEAAAALRAYSMAGK